MYFSRWDRPTPFGGAGRDAKWKNIPPQIRKASLSQVDRRNPNGERASKEVQPFTPAGFR
jgi:hypothetical protein